MKRSLIALLVLSALTAGQAQGNTLLRIVCQKYHVSNHQPAPMVVIAEQLSVTRIGKTKTVTSYALTNRYGKWYTGEVPFRMRVYPWITLVSTLEEMFALRVEEEFTGNPVLRPKNKTKAQRVEELMKPIVEARMRMYPWISLLSKNMTKAQIVEELVRRPAGKDLKGRVLDFKGKGGRLEFTFGIGTDTPYRTFLLLDLLESPAPLNLNGQLQTELGGSNTFADGFYACDLHHIKKD